MMASWREWGVDVTNYEFAADLELAHDLIGPSQESQPIVYPRLVDLITNATARSGQ